MFFCRIWFWTCIVKSRYIAVIYSTTVHTAQQLEWLDFGQTLCSRMTPYNWPLRARYGVSFVSSFEKWSRYIERALNTVRDMAVTICQSSMKFIHSEVDWKQPPVLNPLLKTTSEMAHDWFDIDTMGLGAHSHGFHMYLPRNQLRWKFKLISYELRSHFIWCPI